MQERTYNVSREMKILRKTKRDAKDQKHGKRNEECL